MNQPAKRPAEETARGRRDTLLSAERMSAQIHQVEGDTLKVLRSRNWGDYVAPFLYRRLTGRKPATIPMDKESTVPHYLTIGSVLQLCDRNSVVWGTGFLSEQDDLGLLSWKPGANRVLQAPAAVHAVRGPLTRNKLESMGIPCPPIYGDPALLFPKVYTPSVQKSRYRLGVIAHFTERTIPQVEAFARDPNVLIIDIVHSRLQYFTGDARYYQVIDKIAQCEKVVSGSLHGLILADAYGIPAHWIQLSGKRPTSEFKFVDYFQSVGRSDYIMSASQANSVASIEKGFRSYKLRLDTSPLLESCPFLR
jgi:pyruvyltransferase